MLKNAVLYLVLSILVVIFAHYFKALIIYVDMLYTWINLKISPIFSQSYLGETIRKIIVLTFLPIIITGIPALCYRALSGKAMPHFYFFTWFFWLIIAISLIFIR